MARLARLHAPHVVQRVVQRAAEGRVLFADQTDFRHMVRLLAEAAKAYGVAWHAYVLLPTELQLLATPAAATSLPGAMQALGRQYAPRLNRKSGQAGPIWDGRYRSTLIDAETYLFACMRQIESAPVVTGLVAAPEEWPWSSYRHHVGLETSPVISDHALYWGLRNTPFERQAAYAALDESPVPAELGIRIAEATDKGWALGDEGFLARMEGETSRRLRPLARGRRRVTAPR